MNFAKIWFSMFADGSVRFARFFGQMYIFSIFFRNSNGKALISVLLSLSSDSPAVPFQFLYSYPQVSQTNRNNVIEDICTDIDIFLENISREPVGLDL